MGTDLGACVVLAAGKGTRMKSEISKALHAIGGRSLLGHATSLAKNAGFARTVVVLGPGMEDAAEEVSKWDAEAAIAIQQHQNGTADAVASARAALSGAEGRIAVLFVDTPLVTTETLDDLAGSLQTDGADVAVLGFEPVDPKGYGRLILDDDGHVAAIREEKDATDEERKITLCNSGVMVFSSAELMFSLIDSMDNNNAQGEFYLTDAVELALDRGLKTSVRVCPEEEVLGINTREHLAQAEAVLQRRLRSAAMQGGVTLIDPDTVFLAMDTTFGHDVLVEPNVFFGSGVSVGNKVTVRAFSHLEGATLRDGSVVGPYARLRPDADIGEGAKIGNFVEVKKATIGQGAKVNHLSYVGDAEVGPRANIGAGTITCNYDGFSKHLTEIGEGAFIGSNSALVAPVKIGSGAYVGSGSVITRHVADGALALSRAGQVEKEGWAERFEAMNQKRREKAKT